VPLPFEALLTLDDPYAAALRVAHEQHQRAARRLGPLDANPVLQLTPAVRVVGIDAPGPEWAVGISQEFALGAQIGSRNTARQAEQAVLEVGADARLLERRLGAAHLWLDTWLAQQQLDLIASEMTLVDEVEGLTRRAVAAGERTAADLLQVSAWRSELSLRHLRGEGELVEAGVHLAHALARAPDAASLPVAEGTLPTPPEPPADVLGTLVDKVPTARLAALTARLEEARLRELEASRDLRMTAALMADSDAETNIGVRVGLSFQLPSFDRVDAAAPQQAAEAITARAAADEAARLLRHRLRLLAHTLVQERASEEVIRMHSLPAITEALTLAEKRYRRGEATAFELVELRRRRLEILGLQHEALVARTRAALELWLLWQSTTPGTRGTPGTPGTPEAGTTGSNRSNR
jgi:outer membrane protein TolC